MQLEVGAIFEGKVTGITRFGAFVALPGGGSGLVHISEIANSYVNDVHDCLTEGQAVKVKVIGIGDGGKVTLSIKKAEESPRPQPARPRIAPVHIRAPAEEMSFEDKLKHFMQESDSRMSGNKLYAERKAGNRRRRGEG
jgi:S1 RNA binding domain protein